MLTFQLSLSPLVYKNSARNASTQSSPCPQLFQTQSSLPSTYQAKSLTPCSTSNAHTQHATLHVHARSKTNPRSPRIHTTLNSTKPSKKYAPPNLRSTPHNRHSQLTDSRPLICRFPLGDSDPPRASLGNSTCGFAGLFPCDPGSLLFYTTHKKPPNYTSLFPPSPADVSCKEHSRSSSAMTTQRSKAGTLWLLPTFRTSLPKPLCNSIIQSPPLFREHPQSPAKALSLLPPTKCCLSAY